MSQAITSQERLYQTASYCLYNHDAWIITKVSKCALIVFLGTLAKGCEYLGAGLRFGATVLYPLFGLRLPRDQIPCFSGKIFNLFTSGGVKFYKLQKSFEELIQKTKTVTEPICFNQKEMLSALKKCQNPDRYDFNPEGFNFCERQKGINDSFLDRENVSDLDISHGSFVDIPRSCLTLVDQEGQIFKTNFGYTPQQVADLFQERLHHSPTTPLIETCLNSINQINCYEMLKIQLEFFKDNYLLGNFKGKGRYEMYTFQQDPDQTIQLTYETHLNILECSTSHMIPTTGLSLGTAIIKRSYKISELDQRAFVSDAKYCIQFLAPAVDK
jgi:hypothetical protein